MEINDMDYLIEKIVNHYYNSDEDTYWIPFEKIFEYSEFDDDIVNRIKNELNAHKDIRICEVWDYCFLIWVNKYFTEEEIDR